MVRLTGLIWVAPISLPDQAMVFTPVSNLVFLNP
jgi:hypothetical protein